MKEDEIKEKVYDILTLELRYDVAYNAILALIKDEVRKGQKEFMDSLWNEFINTKEYKDDSPLKYISLLDIIHDRLTKLNALNNPLHK